MLGEISQKLILTEEEINNNFTFKLSSLVDLLLRKTGYFHIQGNLLYYNLFCFRNFKLYENFLATTPDTLGLALTDSPVGLLGYILEKYAAGSFGFKKILGLKDGGLESFNRDDLLTIITHYWMTNTITSSCRLYRSYVYAAVGDYPKNEISSYKTTNKVPIAVQYFKNEVTNIPYGYLKKRYLNLKRFNIMSKGGHFASFENPILSAQDFVEFILSVY